MINYTNFKWIPKVLLLAGFLFFIVIIIFKKEPVLKNDAFALKNEASVNKILLYKNNLPSHGFTRKEASDFWTYDESVKVDNQMSRALLSALKGVTIKSRVAKRNQQKISEYLKQNGFVVEYYHKNYLSKAFFIGSIKGNSSWAYAMLDGDDAPYIIDLPSISQNLTQILSLPESHWADRNLFKISSSAVASIKVDYPAFPKDSFEITRKHNKLLMTGSRRFNSNVIAQYLKNYESIKCWPIPSQNEFLIDSIKLSKPFCTIFIKEVHGDHPKTISLFTSSDPEMLYAKAEDKPGVFILSAESIRTLLLKRKDFI